MLGEWFFKWIINTNVYVFFTRKILPYLNFRLWGYPNCSMMRYFPVRDVLRDPANKDKIYVFVGVDRMSLSFIAQHLLTSNKWSHTGFLYLDSNNEVRMRHVIAKGYEDWSFLSYLREIDYFEIYELSVPFQNRWKVMKRIETIANHNTSIDYDFNFDLSEDTLTALDSGDLQGKLLLYCSEFIYLVGAGLTYPDLKTHFTYGRKTFEPDDVSKYCIPVLIPEPLLAV